ncbi:MAG: glycosyltransferase family 4 protein, partial [Nitrospinota bacterium]
MVILIAADVSIKSVTGGAERVLYEESTRLAKKGHDVYILTRRLPCHSCNYEVIEGVKEYRYEVDQRNSLAFLYTTIVNSRRMFLSLIKEKSFDVINFHQPFTAFGINLIKESQNIRKVYTCLSLSFEEYETRHAKPHSYIRFMNYTINSKIRRYIERKSLFKSCKIIVLSDFTTQK